MPSRILAHIYQNANFQIPVYFKDDKAAPYLRQLKKQYNLTNKILESVDDVIYAPAIKSDILSRLRRIQAALLRVFEAYFEGYPAKAFQYFKDLLEIEGLKDEVNTLQQHKIEKNQYLFRTQPVRNNLEKSQQNVEGFINLQNPKALFHPPFENRRSVKTNRFSISGFPCLYVSQNLLTSFSESFPDRGTSQAFNSVAYKNIRPLYFMDLTLDNLISEQRLFKGIGSGQPLSEEINVMIEYLGVYQLILASHTKVNYQPSYKGEQYSFKAEYVIPQLLLQWLKQEGYAIDGIRYKSCTGEARFPKAAFHYNYVLPVQSNLEKGLCPTLRAVLYSSSVYSYTKSYNAKSIRKTLKGISQNLMVSNFALIK